MGLIVAAGSEPVPGYQVVRKLGEGGFGEVWEAEAPGGVHVALKLIKLNTRCSESELRALEIIRNIRHPNLLDVQFSVQVEDALVIAMPLCDQNLWDRLAECRAGHLPGIPRAELIGYMEELAKAVDFLNEPRHLAPDGTRIGIQHRDIKPHNIFLVGGSARLADFGLAKFLGGGAASHTGCMSPNYVAPEALSGKTAAQSDQYSLAVTYVFLLCGKLPITGSTIHELIYNLVYGEPELSCLSREEIPVVKRALSKEPEGRWPSCQVFVSALKDPRRGATLWGRTTASEARALLPGLAVGGRLGSALRALLFFRKPPAIHKVMHAEPGRAGPRQSVGGESLALPMSTGGETIGSGRDPLDPTRPNGPEGGDADLSTVKNGDEVGRRVVTGLSRTEAAEKTGAAEDRPEDRVPTRAIGIAAVVLGLAAMCLSVGFPRGKHSGSREHGVKTVATGGTTSDVSRVIPAIPAPGGVDPAASPRAAEVATVATPATPVVRRVFRFEPPGVKVEINGEPRLPDAEGRVFVECTGDAPVKVVARAEGFRDLTLSVPGKAWVGRDTTFRLEPEEIAPDALAERARDVLRRRCHGCHGVEFLGSTLDVLDRPGLLQARGDGRAPFVVPGDAERSALWKAVGVGSHPGAGAGSVPTEAERHLIRRWIDAGAKFPVPPRRPFRTERHLLTAIRDHLRAAPEDDRKFLRYFSFTRLHDDGRLGGDDLRLARAALSKLLNSLSWQPDVVVPTGGDPDGLYLCVDLRGLGWDNDGHWQEILKAYPYGLTHEAPDDPLREVWGEVQAMTGEDIPYLRADWFVSEASRPPLYHTLLRLPATARQLESLLHVDADRDFLEDRVARAGVSISRVSGRNQVSERHRAGGRAYWKAFDLRSGQEKGYVFKHPLGPDLAGNPFRQDAFSASGAEILFQLPNGLQGYMLAGADGTRVDHAGPDLAADPLRSSGSSSLVNGVSCLACHRRGVSGLKDEVRASSSAAGTAAVKVKALYPPPSEMDKLIEQDQRRFVSAQARAMDPFLQVPGGDVVHALDVPEPIAAVVRWFGQGVGIEDVAGELGVEDASTVRAKILDVPRLRKLGLEPLLAGHSITRSVWQECFDQMVIELELGTPHRTF